MPEICIGQRVKISNPIYQELTGKTGVFQILDSDCFAVVLDEDGCWIGVGPEDVEALPDAPTNK